MFQTIIDAAGLLGVLITAVATIFLWRATKVLAIATDKMAAATAQPHVVATIAVNQWTSTFVDLIVENTGNATAYDVQIKFDPPLPPLEVGGKVVEFPLQKISVLKPGQNIKTALTWFKHVQGKSYAIQSSWCRIYGSNEPRATNDYLLNMMELEEISILNEGNPDVYMAKRIDKIEKNIDAIARGNNRLKIDIFSSMDRLRSLRENQRMHRQLARQREVTKNANDEITN